MRVVDAWFQIEGRWDVYPPLYNVPDGVVPVIENIHQKVYAAASQPGALNMANWHTYSSSVHDCATAHCRAGWAVTLAGEAGAVLEAAVGTKAAAYLIYFASDPTLTEKPEFYVDNDYALEIMRLAAEREAGR